MQMEKTRDRMLRAMFVALIAAGEFIRIPVPVVPFTLQYLFTMLAGLLLGGRKGYRQFAYARGVFSRPFLTCLYAMVPYVIGKEDLVRVLGVMKEWFRR